MVVLELILLLLLCSLDLYGVEDEWWDDVEIAEFESESESECKFEFEGFETKEEEGGGGGAGEEEAVSVFSSRPDRVLIALMMKKI